MNQCPLPPIFAVYRPETRTFSIFQPDLILDTVIHDLIVWNRPLKSCWSTCSDKRRVEVRRWFGGQRWYIVRNQEKNNTIQDVIIKKKPYTFWSLNHSLIWAKSRMDTIEECPSIPVIEFNSQKLLSANKPGFHIVWKSVQHEDLLQESAAGWGELFDRINAESGSEKPLRICTPKPKASESDQEQEDTFAIPVDPPSWVDTVKSWIGVGLYACTAVTIVTVYTTIIRAVIGI
jgi:hypothetical protein